MISLKKAKPQKKKPKTAAKLPPKKALTLPYEEFKNLIAKLIVLDIAVENVFNHGPTPRIVANLSADKINLRQALNSLNGSCPDCKRLFITVVDEHNKRAENIQKEKKKEEMKFDRRVY
ncbi:MAG: hypothetical protein ABH829_01165 [archaeon]